MYLVSGVKSCSPNKIEPDSVQLRSILFDFVRLHSILFDCTRFCSIGSICSMIELTQNKMFDYRTQSNTNRSISVRLFFVRFCSIRHPGKSTFNETFWNKQPHKLTTRPDLAWDQAPEENLRAKRAESLPDLRLDRPRLYTQSLLGWILILPKKKLLDI